MTDQVFPSPALLRARDVANLLGTSETTVWRYTQQGHLPAPIKLGNNMTRWRADEISAHIQIATVERDSTKKLLAIEDKTFAGVNGGAKTGHSAGEQSAILSGLDC